MAKRPSRKLVRKPSRGRVRARGRSSSHRQVGSLGRLIDQLHVGVVVCGEDLRVRSANERAVLLWGRSSAELIGTRVDDARWAFLREDPRCPRPIIRWPASCPPASPPRTRPWAFRAGMEQGLAGFG